MNTDSHGITARFLRIFVAPWWMLFCIAGILAASAVAASNHPAAAKTGARVAPAPPSIILITLDTTRADRMGFLGSKRGLTPNLDALAQQSTIFTRAYAQIPITPGSHATILSGTYPQFHHLNTFGQPLPKDLPYAPDILHAHGYHTAAFIGSIVLSPETGNAPGFDRGFDFYDAGFRYEGPDEDPYNTIARRGKQVVAHALAWLNKHPKGPFFIWVHLYDAHGPYNPPEPYKSRYAKAPYDGGIAYDDAVVGNLIGQLKLRGLYDGAVIAITADHGESLGAHGEDEHGIFLYDETIHVPLLIKLPRSTAVERRVENWVELVDILPTLLQEVGIAIPVQVQGESLLDLMKAKPPGGNTTAQAWHDRPAYSQSEYPHAEFGWSALRSLRTGKYLYIQAPRRELYDESTDPEAQHNLASTSSAVADTLAGQTEAFRQKTSSSRETATAALDPDAQAKLGALGYMASGNSFSKTPVDQGADPKDKIEIADMILRAEHMQQDMPAAIGLLEEVVSKEPSLPLYSKLGDWMLLNNDFHSAMPVFRKALEMDPGSMQLHFRLAKCLMATQDFDAAIPELEKVVARVPNEVEAHSLLELAYSRTNRVADAIKECRTVLEYDPEDYGSYLILGQSQARSGDPQAGIATLKKAASLQPESPIAHVWLADIYDQLGQKADAARERAEAKRLGTVPHGPKGP
ncbi:MAG: sulfatase-like hydrolase/transferase [Terriglobales bacterium]